MTPAALLCLETEPRIRDGFWTFDPARVAAREEYVAAELEGARAVSTVDEAFTTETGKRRDNRWLFHLRVRSGE